MSLYVLTLAEMKAELGLTDTRDDAVLTRWMEGLQARFDAYCERTFERGVNVEETHHGGETAIYLRRFPVETISAVYVDGAAVAADDYRASKHRGVLRYGGAQPVAWPGGNESIRVVFTGGYVPAGTNAGATQWPMPENVRRAFTIQAGFEWRNRANLGKASMSAGGQSVSLAEAKLLPEVREIIDGMRRML